MRLINAMSQFVIYQTSIAAFTITDSRLNNAEIAHPFG